jgi:kynurenine formamidase
MSPSAAAALKTAELDRLYEDVNNWARWGRDDERGCLNFLTDEIRAGVGGLVRDGGSFSLAHDFPVSPSVETPFPALHHMLHSGDCLDAPGVPGYEATADYIGTQVHGLGLTHVDALSHMFVRGKTYNGFLPEDVKSIGALKNTIMSMADGVIGRGVLLDVPAALGVEWLPPAQSVRSSDLLAAEKRQGLELRRGDIVLISTGRDARRAAQKGVLNPFSEGLAGLHPECLKLLHEREIAVLGGDGISDHMPFLPVPEWPFPIHQIGIVSMGLHLIDNLHLAPLARACASRRRWEFLFTMNPLRITRGTGCPANPVATF